MLPHKGDAVRQPGAPELKRATYYLRRDQIMALRLLSVLEDRRLSEVVREAVDQYLEEHA